MKYSKNLPLCFGFVLAILGLVGCGISEPAETLPPESFASAVSQPTETAVPPTETAVPTTPTPELTLEPTVIPDTTPAWAAGLIGTLSNGYWFRPAIEPAPEFYSQFDDGRLYHEETLPELKKNHATSREAAIYWFEGDVFESPCEEQTGRYQITILPNESMEIERIEDNCEARTSAIAGTWTWMSP